MGLEEKEYEGLEQQMTGLPSTPLTVYIGLEAVTVWIRAYTVIGEVDNAYDHTKTVAIAKGTRLLLTCDVIVLPENSEVVSYRWYHSLTGETQNRYQIQDREPYYSVVKDTLLVDVSSWDQGGKYSCFVMFREGAQSTGITAILTVAS